MMRYVKSNENYQPVTSSKKYLSIDCVMNNKTDVYCHVIIGIVDLTSERSREKSSILK